MAIESQAAASSAPESNDVMIVLSFTMGEIVVERSLLTASSEYFAAMLSGNPDWQEAKERTVHLDHWRPRQIVTIIRWLRTKNPKPILNNINYFFPAIDYFSIKPLLNLCIELKLDNISNKNVLDEFRFAKIYSIRRLLDRCMEHLIANVGTILEQPRLNQKVSLEIFQALLKHKKLAVANEDAVLALIDRWCSVDGRNSHRLQLLQSVRFAHLTPAAFEKCRLNEQCLRVANFRALIESSRWSDLNENLLSGRAYTQVHMHAVWVRKVASTLGDYRFPYEQLANPNCGFNALVSCSASGRNVWECFSGKYASVMTYRSYSASFGHQLFFYAPFWRDFHHQHHRLTATGKVLGFRDHYSQEPNVAVNLENGIFPVAPPVVVAGDLYIAHVTCKPEQIHNSEASQSFAQLEVVRYHDGDVERRGKAMVSSTEQSWCRLLNSLISLKTNRLCVRDHWKMLLVPSKGLLLAIDRQPASGAIIRLPNEFWNGNGFRVTRSTFADMVISDDKAYIALEFKYSNFIRRGDGTERFEFCREEIVSSVIVCDLVGGKLLQKVDLSSILSERISVPQIQEFELYLKEIQNEIHLLGFTKHVMASKNGDIGARGFAYRLQLSDDRLEAISVMNDFEIEAKKFVPRRDEVGGSSQTLHMWEGRQLSVDAHLCEHATVLQHRASEESDPIRLEKLRRFTW